MAAAQHAGVAAGGKFCRVNGNGWIAQSVEDGIDVLEGGKSVGAFSSGFDFAQRLWPSQHQDAHHGNFGWSESEAFIENMLVLVHSASGPGMHDAGQFVIGA